MKRWVWFSVVMMSCICLSSVADAKTVRRNRMGASSSGPWLKEKEWTDQAGGKALYGLKNTLLGWTELLTEPYEGATTPGDSFVAGVGRGVWNAVGQTVGGAADVVTFPFTGAVVPLPEGGTSAL